MATPSKVTLVISTLLSPKQNAMPMPLSRSFGLLKAHFFGHPGRLLKTTIKTFFLAHLFLEYGYSIGGTYGASMLPTFEVSRDWVIESRFYRRGKDIVVGDVISFDSVVEPGQKVIKRVLGLEGDYVLRGTPGESDVMVQVPQGHVWVVGDNLSYSRDSRHFGPLPKALIRSKIIAKILPWKERKWVVNELQLNEA